MKLFRQALIILGIYLCGEFLASVFSLPVPGNILGMIILFLLLYFKIVKVENIKEVSDFLLNHLAFFFIPAGVGLMASFDVIKNAWIQILVICVLTTTVMICITGRTVQAISKNKSDNEKEGVSIDCNN